MTINLSALQQQRRDIEPVGEQPQRLLAQPGRRGADSRPRRAGVCLLWQPRGTLTGADALAAN